MISTSEKISVNRVIRTLGLSKGTLYYKRRPYIRHHLFCREIPSEWVTAVKKICDQKATYGIPRVRTLLRRDYSYTLSYYMVHRIMKEEELLIHRTACSNRREREHTGHIAVDQPNVRWSSDITGILPWNRDKGRFAYVLDCCDRSIISWRFQRNIQACDIELMLQDALYKRFGGDLPNGHGVEFLHDNGPEYIEKELQKRLLKWNVNDCRTPTYSPQSNGMCEAFNGTFKRDYVYENSLDNFETVKEQIGKWVEEYNTFAPHSALKMMTPLEFFNFKMAA